MQISITGRELDMLIHAIRARRDQLDSRADRLARDGAPGARQAGDHAYEYELLARKILLQAD